MNQQIYKFRNAMVNAARAKKSHLDYAVNPFILNCIVALYYEGVIQSFVITGPKVRIILRNVSGYIIAKELKTTKREVVMKYADIARMRNCALKVYLFSTPKGILSRIDCLKAKTGGILCLYT